MVKEVRRLLFMIKWKKKKRWFSDRTELNRNEKAIEISNNTYIRH